MAEYSDSLIAMTAAEETAFLDSFKTARIATISPDGYPHNVPVGYDHRDGRIYMPSDEQSQKIANIERTSKICFIVDEGVASRDVESMKGIMIQGDAEIFGETEHPEVKHDSLVDGMMETEEIAEPLATTTSASIASSSRSFPTTSFPGTSPKYTATDTVVQRTQKVSSAGSLNHRRRDAKRRPAETGGNCTPGHEPANTTVDRKCVSPGSPAICPLNNSCSGVGLGNGECESTE